jgi:uncharacterized membrane protein
LKAHKNKVLKGFPPISGVWLNSKEFNHRGIRQIDTQECPLDSLLREKCTECSRPSTRKTKLKENFIMKNKKVAFLTQAAIIAAVYVVLGVAFAAFGKGAIQVRIAEALTILPLFTPAAIPGVFIGCLLSNVLSGAILLDVIFGSLASLIGAIGTYTLRKCRPILATLPPILANTIIVPLILRYGYGDPLPIPFMMLTVGIGEILSCGVLGILLYTALKPMKAHIFDKI